MSGNFRPEVLSITTGIFAAIAVLFYFFCNKYIRDNHSLARELVESKMYELENPI
jgi:hypothetical protein